MRSHITIWPLITLVGVALGWILLPVQRSAATEKPASVTPNVLLITIDTLRPDRLSAYGYQKQHTPTIDRLAREGVLFENAFCDVTWTTPSMTSVMTGRYATVHGVRSTFERLGDAATTLAELLHDQGIHTAAIVASYPLASIFGLNQGFDLYDEDFSLPLASLADPEAEGARKKVTPGPDLFGQSRWPMLLFILNKSQHDAYRPDNAVSDRAIRWLRDERREPFFLWVHYLGPHRKPLLETPADTRPERRGVRYDRDVRFADEQVGRLLAAVDESGAGARTVVILHADHGESLTAHGFFGHGVYLYDATQHVPLIIRTPDRQHAGQRVARLVRNLDLFPTVLALMGVKATVPTDGTSLLPLVAGKRAAQPQETYMETYLPAHSLFATPVTEPGHDRIGFRRFGIRTPDWKFIVNDPIPILDRDDPPPLTPELKKRYFSEELYDLHADPKELTNVIAAHTDLAASFRAKIARYQALGTSKSEPVNLDSAGRERLRSLGYLGD